MPTFIRLINLTEQGARNIKNLSKMIELAQNAMKKHNTKVLNLYTTLGNYDLVAIIEAPNAARRVVLQAPRRKQPEWAYHEAEGDDCDDQAVFFDANRRHGHARARQHEGKFANLAEENAGQKGARPGLAQKPQDDHIDA